MPPNKQPQSFTHTQPRTYSITLKSLLSLPFRLCNPPPAVGKVRSCGMTPLIKVRLEDVLDRQHLPPLGLKDFEEWLLFVEMSPENLYFILWLREYKQRYTQWQSQTAFHLRTDPSLDLSTQYSSQLAMFYARAKQTFFTPGSAYELNLASSLLAPFHRPAAPPYPPPSALRDIELDTYRTLEASLRRFVHAQLNNVGNRRVLCGILAGIAACLIGAAAPLAVLFTRHDGRWARLAALPGLWLGLTILIASLNGICLGVYIFGDLRQLRRFELARPRISKPRPLPAFSPIAKVADAAHVVPGRGRAPSVASMKSMATDATGGTGDNIHISPAYYDADDTADDDTTDLYAPRPESALGFDAGWDIDRGLRHADPASDAESDDSASIASRARNVTSPTPSAPRSVLSTGTAASEATIFTGTATFIHPFELAAEGAHVLGARGAHADDADTDEVLARAIQLPARHQPVAPFDFEGLPVWGGAADRRGPRSHGHHGGRARAGHLPRLDTRLAAAGGTARGHVHAHAPWTPTVPSPTVPLRAARTRGVRGALARMQERCGLAQWRLQVGYLEDVAPQSPAPHWSSPYWAQTRGGGAHGNGRSSADSEKTRMGEGEVYGYAEGSESEVGVGRAGVGAVGKGKEGKGDGEGAKCSAGRETGKKDWWRRRLRAMRSVPAFAVPLARVLSPVVVRGQWEIVVRSALLAALISAGVLVAVLAVPVF